MRRCASLAVAGLLVLPAGAAAGGRDIGYKVPEAPPHCTAHFCVHYVREGPDAPVLSDAGGAPGVPDYVETVGAAAEAARAHHNGRLRWRQPRGDGLLGGGGRDKTDVYLADLGGDPQAISGATSLDRGDRSSYFELHNGLGIDPDNSGGVWKVVAHEYGHVLEHAYATGMDTWMSEGTAEWLADEAYAHSAIDNVFKWAQAPQVPMTEFRRTYSAVVWNHWIASRYGRGGVRNAWAVARSARPRGFAPAAYDKALRNLPGPGLRARGLPFWREFALLAATSAEWRIAGLPRATVWPDVRRQGTLERRQTVRRRLDHLAYELWDVPAVALTGRLRLRVRVRAGTKAGVALVGRRAGSVTRRVRLLPRGGTVEVRLDDARGLERVTAVLVNADPAARATANEVHYLRDNRLFVARLR
jgi:hypothetical protein